jgi:hypothetical protein
VVQGVFGPILNTTFDGQDLALVLDNQGKVLERELYGSAADQVLASETAAGGTVNWFLTDNQATVRDVVQYSGGTASLVDHLVYDSFGQITWQSQAANQPRFGYDGMHPDSASGLYHDAGRW